MNYKNYLEAVKQGYIDPCEYNENSRYCEVCDIEENKKLYFNGCLQYDKEYIKEHKKNNTLFN